MAQLYHWPVPCTICENPVEYHCNACGDALCSKCRDIHLKNNPGRNHDVVPYTQRIEPRKLSLQCGHHPNQQCRVWCQTCNIRVCRDCVTSTKHKGHRFLKFDDKIVEKRKDIQRKLDRYSKILSEWQISLKEAEQMKDIYEKDVNQLDKEIVYRAYELCKRIREVEIESRKQLQEMKDTSLRVLQNQQKILEDGIQRLRKKIEEIEDAQRSRDPSTLLQYSVVEENIPGTKPSFDDLPYVPDFTPGFLNIQVLKNMFGSLSDDRLPSLKPMPSDSIKALSQSTNPYIESIIDIEAGCYTPDIACVGSGQAWVRTAEKRLQLRDKKGKVKRTVRIDYIVNDINVTPQGDILLPDYNNNLIRSMSMEGKIRTFFKTQRKPHSICCLPGGEIVVAFRDDKKVVQYNSAGKIMKEIGNSLFQYPWYVAHGQVNQQLYVCDKSNSYDPSALGRILAFHINGALQYTYTGSDKTFAPTGVCAYLAGHVLITDKKNHRIHILDKGGFFIRYLLTGEEGMTKPYSIDIDSDGYAWIGEYNTGKVKVVKYT